jgi:transcriptional regulator GlxA family with amidase domain
VRALRVDEARRQLETTERGIDEIAFACGFDSIATFYRTFQAAHGMSPGEFRATQVEHGLQLQR